MAARSIGVTFYNQTGQTLRLTNSSLSHGVWASEPSSKIAPNSQTYWSSESDRFMTGTEGFCTYQLMDGTTVTLTWDNPYAGSNSFHVELSGEKAVNHSGEYAGGDGDNAAVSFTLRSVSNLARCLNTIAPVMTQIDTVVMISFENRSLDNLLGFLYADGTSFTPYPSTSSTTFNGVPTNAVNRYHGKPYSPTNGTQSAEDVSALRMPNYDPNEVFEHVRKQLYANDYGTMPSGDYWATTPPMTGFAWDYDAFETANQAVMGSYSAAQLPALHGLAKSYAVSDRWFASIPSQTFANRAFQLCGTSLGCVDNDEITGETFSDIPTIFNILAAASKSWGIYWQTDGGLGAGSPRFDPFTPWLCPEIAKAPNGSVYHFDDNNNNEKAFIQALKAGTLPNFCFLEPKWGGGAGPAFIQGNDYHPPAYVGPAEYDLNELYNAIIQSPQWPTMLLIITFDEHGGTYDHEPPPKTISPDGVTGESGFAFNRLGVRVPTLLISPFIPGGVVFRSPVEGVDFDHTSFVATLLKWAGVDPAKAGLGRRVAIAPTFEGVLSATRRSDTPTFSVDPSYENQGAMNTWLGNQFAPTDGFPQPSPIKLADFRAASANSESPEDFVKRVQALQWQK